MAGLRPTVRQLQKLCKYFARAVNTDYNPETERERERGRKSLSGEMVGNRDVNAGESRGEGKACQHLYVGMLGWRNGGRKMAT